MPLLLWSATALAQSPQANLTPENPALGQDAVLVLDPAPVDSTYAPVGFGVLVTPTETAGRYAVVPVRTGSVGIVTAPGDTLGWTIAASIEEPFPERLRPLKSAQPVRPRWWPTIALIAAVVAIPVVWLLRRLRRRRRPAPAFAIASEPPHDVALRRLQQLVDGDLLNAEQFDQYYVEASHALRTYICGRYRVPVLDWTSAEVVDRLRAAGYQRDLVATVGPLLMEADSVKFAADRPTPHAAGEWVQRARTWIQETAVEPVYSTPEAIAAAEVLTTGGHS